MTFFLKASKIRQTSYLTNQFPTETSTHQLDQLLTLNDPSLGLDEEQLDQQTSPNNHQENNRNKKGFFNFSKTNSQEEEQWKPDQNSGIHKREVSVTKITNGYTVNFQQDVRRKNIAKNLTIENDFGEINFLEPVSLD